MKLILATHNQHKVTEIKHLLKAHPEFEVLTLDDVGIHEEIEETGVTFEENAKLKAEWVSRHTGLMALADDSGIEIEAFDNEPGVYSSRYLGENTPYSVKNAIILERIATHINRKARYVSVVAIAEPGKPTRTFRGEMSGNIAPIAEGEGGFGYDPIFIADGYTRTIAQMPLDEKNRISHRHKSLKQAIAYLFGEDPQ